MNKLVVSALFAIAASLPLSAQTVTISDFSTAPSGVNFTGGLLTWNNGTADQFTTSGGILTVAPVSGGNPDHTGYFAGADIAGGAFNGTILTQLSVTARIDSGNVGTGFSVIFLDSAGTEALYGTFVADGISPNSFTTSGFSTQTVTMIAHPNAGSASDITYWGISGSATTQAFRMSFDSIQVSAIAVPEPSTYAIISGLLALGYVALRRRSVGV